MVPSFRDLSLEFRNKLYELNFLKISFNEFKPQLKEEEKNLINENIKVLEEEVETIKRKLKINETYQSAITKFDIVLQKLSRI